MKNNASVKMFDEAFQSDKNILDTWKKRQIELKKMLVYTDPVNLSTAAEEVLNVSNDPDILSSSLQRVGGVDISFVKGNATKACACLVVLEWPSMKVLFSKQKIVELTAPYIPGYLAFRECPFLVDLVNEVRREKGDSICPQLLFVDGNGILHPRGFGLASQLGVLTNLPTIGIGKNLMMIDGLENETIRKAVDDASHRGDDSISLVGNSGKTHGATLIKIGSTSKPIFISCGNNVTLQTAVTLTRACSKYRIPEPIRQADLISRKVLRDMKSNIIESSK